MDRYLSDGNKGVKVDKGTEIRKSAPARNGEGRGKTGEERVGLKEEPDSQGPWVFC